MRFALLIVKVAVVALLQNFSFRTCRDTPVRIWDDVFHYLPFSPTEMVLYSFFCIHLRTKGELSLMHIKSLSSPGSSEAASFRTTEPCLQTWVLLLHAEIREEGFTGD